MSGVTTIAPERTDGVVTLRAFRPDDIDEMVVMGRDPDTVRYTSIPHPYERAHAEEWVAEPGKDRSTVACWAIEAEDGGRPRFAGCVDLRGHPPEIGFVLAPWARGRGHMARAVRLATRWAFAEAGLPVVHWRAQAGHFASWRVAHACGFAFHGELPLAIPQRSTLRDAWQASLRATDDARPRTTWWPTPVLENARVRLRPAADADFPRITQACRDPRTRHWLPDLPDPYTDDDARAFVRQGALEASLGRRVGWAVADPADDRLLARISDLPARRPAEPDRRRDRLLGAPGRPRPRRSQRGPRPRGRARVRARQPMAAWAATGYRSARRGATRRAGTSPSARGSRWWATSTPTGSSAAAPSTTAPGTSY